jgi:glycerol-3-phosphate dehydrogenase (NAD(P)+)
MSEKIAILGAGSWGIAIANLLHGNGHKINLWEFNRDDYLMLRKSRVNDKRLPGTIINPEIKLVNDLAEAVADVTYIVFAAPAQKMREVCLSLENSLTEKKKFVNLAKGVEVGTLLRMSEIISEIVSFSDKKEIASLSGPSHAEEVAMGLPTSVVAASASLDYAGEIQRLFSSSFFRVYRSQDIIGVELGGALKNVIAIASGITQGLGYGDNTTGALITRGLAEITRMGIRLGADAATFAGLSGIGDLVTTCISRHSRNRYVGDKIGRGEKLKDILAGMTMVAEGVDTCRSAKAMSDKYGVEMPITAQVHKVLFENRPPLEAVADLMGRPLKEEVWK